MKALNFDKIISEKYFELASLTNQIGQKVTLVEDPFNGSDSKSIVLFFDEKKAFRNNFYYADEFYHNSEYLPILLKDGGCVCFFESEFSDLEF